MASLTNCFRKAGTLLRAQDKTAIVNRAKELRSEGLTASKANKQALSEQIESLKTTLAEHEKNSPTVVEKPAGARNVVDWLGVFNQPAYQGEHQPAMGDSGAPLSDLASSGVYPEDVYGPNGSRYYGDGSAMDNEAFGIVRSLRNRPNASVTIYRAVPYEKTNQEKLAALQKQKAAYMARRIVPAEWGGSRTSFGDEAGFFEWVTAEIKRLEDAPEEKREALKINPGDWVAITRSYAKGHGESALRGNYKIISKKVTAKEIFTNGDSIQEWGYDPTGKSNQRTDQTQTPAFKKWFGDSKVVDDQGKPLASRSGLVAARKAASLEGGVDGGTSDAKPVADLLVSQAFSLEGLSGLEVPAQRKVLKGVLSLGDDLKVLRSIVELIPVDVVDILARKNLSPEVLFSDEAVLKELLSADRDGSVSAAIDVADALVAAVAGVAAKGSAIAANPFVRSQKDGPAADASDGDFLHGGIVNQVIGNSGTFDPNDANILNQGENRGSFSPSTSTITLFKQADLSTFLHETGHFFLELQSTLAADPNAPKAVKDDMDRLLDWFGIKGDENLTALDKWHSMSLDEQRESHEKFARGFEAYLFEGNAPNVELQGVFQRFRSWLINVYKSIKNLNVQLTPEVRGVMDRMLATQEQIEAKEAAQSMGLMFKTQEEATKFGLDWAKYHAQGEEATAKAVDELGARSLKDMQWLDNAKSRELKRLQKDAAEKRAEVRREVRPIVLSSQLYRAWAFLTGKDGEQLVGEKPAGKSSSVNPETDNLFEAIAKLGGLDRDAAQKLWGIDPKEKLASGVFGAPVLRKTGGLSVDSMAELLAEEGYLLTDENGKADLAKFEELFEDQRRGTDRYSIKRDMAAAYGEDGAAGPEPTMARGKFRLGDFFISDQAKQRLQSLRMTNEENGMHPDIVAELFGYSSGSELIDQITTSMTPNEAVNYETDKVMMEKYGDITSPEALDRAANEAIHNAARQRMVATELKALEKANDVKTGKIRTLPKAAKQFAEGLIARLKVRDIKPNRYEVAEARAARNAEKAMRAGDIPLAAEQKRNQLINGYATRAALDALAEVQKINEFFRKITKGSNEKIVKGGRDPDVVNAMRAVLAAYDIAPRLEKGALDYMETVSRNDPEMYDALAPGVQAAISMAQPIDQMTVEQLRGLHDEMLVMWHLAKRSRQMEVDGNLMDLDDAADELIARMQTIGIPETVPGEKGSISPGEEAGIKLQFAKAILSRVEQWAERMDGKFGGPFLKLVFQPIKEAADRYRADRVTYRKEYTELLKKVGPFLPRGPIQAPELGYTFGNARDSGMAEIQHAILHFGNESNMRKLLLGRGWATENADGTVDTRRWNSFISRLKAEGKLKAEHYDFAQGVWDLLEKTKPLAQQTHRNVFGRYFDEVTADSFTDPFGNVRRGGYVPAQTDSRLVKDAKLRELAEGENESMAYAFPSSPSGFTKSRVEYNKPLLLDLRTLAQHLDKVLLFSHMQGAVTDVRRLLTQKDVSRALDRINPGAYEGMLIPWLNRSAKQIVETPIAGDRKLSRFMSAARSRAGMALMMGNISNTVQQITGFSMAAVKVKPSLMMRATGEFVSSPKAMKKSVAESSEFMKNRMLNEVAAMNNVVEEILVNPSKMDIAQNWTQKHAYFLQSAIDNTMAPIIWTAAYNQAIEQGQEHKDAVRFADGTVRQTQGTTLPEDISRFESGPATARIFTQFIGYFNMMANTNATAMKQVVDDVGLKKGAGKLLYIALAGLLVPIWVSEAIALAFRGGPDDGDDDGWYIDDWLAAVFGMGTLRGLTAQVPIVGQAAQLAANRFNDNPADDKFSMSPAVSLIESAVSSPHSVYKAIIDEGNAQKAVRDVAAAATMLTGLPFYTAARPAGYAAGVVQGKTEPTSGADLVRGLATGTPSKESKQ
jgi:hypothetical protein